MSSAEIVPVCSFCGSPRRDQLIRAGSRDHWICWRCVARPVAEDAVQEGMPCTFCQEPIDGSRRTIVIAKRGAVLCNECLRVCFQIIKDTRALRGHAKPS
jgi:hypothetical protein